MDADRDEFLAELLRARGRIEYLEQNPSSALHLFYVSISWILAIAPPELESTVAKMIRAKILQMPQGCPLGQLLIELDEQNGGLLESKGIHLSRWVYEPRNEAHE